MILSVLLSFYITYILYRNREENIMHVLKECEATKDEMPIEEFLSEEGCNAIKRINKIRVERKREEEERKAKV